MSLIATQYSGAATATDPLEGNDVATQAGVAGSITSGTFSTSSDTGAIIAIAQTANNTPTWTAGSGFTVRQVQSSWAHALEDDLVSVDSLTNTTSSISYSPSTGNTSLITAWFAEPAASGNTTDFFNMA